MGTGIRGTWDILDEGGVVLKGVVWQQRALKQLSFSEPVRISIGVAFYASLWLETLSLGAVAELSHVKPCIIVGESKNLSVLQPSAETNNPSCCRCNYKVCITRAVCKEYSKDRGLAGKAAVKGCGFRRALEKSSPCATSRFRILSLQFWNCGQAPRCTATFPELNCQCSRLCQGLTYIKRFQSY